MFYYYYFNFYKKNNFFSAFKTHLKTYPAPINLNYFWNFGFLLGIILVIQILTGIFLTFNYIPAFNLAFFSVDFISRNIYKGWFFRYAHSTGASFFFIFIYIHISKALYYKSFLYKNSFAWQTGFVLFLILIIIAFLGYSLVFSSMAYAGISVILNFASVIPFFGKKLVFWLYGGFSIGQPTITRFLALHMALPFLLAFFVILHILKLHKFGSNNIFLFNHTTFSPLKLFFYPFFILKDFVGVFIFFICFIYFISFLPDLFLHPASFIKANPLVTPSNIAPEWYVCCFYAILRSVPNKSLGVLLMVASICIFFFLPFLTELSFFLIKLKKTKITVNFFNFFKKKTIFWFFVIIFILLTILGEKPVAFPFVFFGQVFTFLFFFLLLNLSINYYFSFLK